jgi:hypothetical protein
MEMEIIHSGTDDVFELESLNCCFPAGTMSMSVPEMS